MMQQRSSKLLIGDVVWQTWKC